MHEYLMKLLKFCYMFFKNYEWYLIWIWVVFKRISTVGEGGKGGVKRAASNRQKKK
jgi:hypothetical protein